MGVYTGGALGRQGETTGKVAHHAKPRPISNQHVDLYVRLCVCVRCCLCDRKKAPILHIQAWLSVNVSRAEIKLHTCVVLDSASDIDQHSGGGHGGNQHEPEAIVHIIYLSFVLPTLPQTNTDTGLMTSHEKYAGHTILLCLACLNLKVLS